MKPYIYSRNVQAARIVTSTIAGDPGEEQRHIETDDGSTFDMPAAALSNSPPDAFDDGYLVRYQDGALSAWRADEFEAAFKAA